LTGPKGDGNVYDPENVKDFEAFVLENTQGHGVHFMMADGVSISMDFVYYAIFCLLRYVHSFSFEIII
jgi:cap1 methyltransferase